MGSKGATTGGEHEAGHLGGPARPQRLMDGGVLAVDRQDACPGLLRQTHHQRPGHHERFLVGQGHHLARLHGRPGAREARRANNRRHNPVHLRLLHQIVERLRTDCQAGACREGGGPDRGGGLPIDHHQMARPAGMRLLQQEFRAAMGRQEVGREPPLRGCDHLQRAAPHAPGRSQHSHLQRTGLGRLGNSGRRGGGGRGSGGVGHEVRRGGQTVRQPES